jgi:stress response protein SCP2/uncharacterized protein YegL
LGTGTSGVESPSQLNEAAATKPFAIGRTQVAEILAVAGTLRGGPMEITNDRVDPMTELTKGGNTALSANSLQVDIGLEGIGAFDTAVLGIQLDGKIHAPGGQEYICLFSQPQIGAGAIALQDGNRYAVDLARIPQDVAKLVIAASLAEGSPGTMASLTRGQLRVSHQGNTLASYRISRQDISGQETSLIFGELYRHQRDWKVRAVGQGFNNGFAALLKSYGVVIDDAPATPAATPIVNLQKQRLVNLEKSGHPLVSLAKQARVSFEKAGLGDLQSVELVLILDTSGSMKRLYREGIVQLTCERTLAAAAILDDDGKVPIIGFDHDAKRIKPDLDLTNFQGHVQRHVGNDLGGGTNYAPAIKLVRELPDGEPWIANGPIKTAKAPRVVLFVTDGNAQDQPRARQMIIEASREPLFFVFVGVGNEKFVFLQQLDELPGRYLDNASTMFIADMERLTDQELYTLLTKELPSWLRQAREFGLLADDPRAVAADAALMQKITQRVAQTPPPRRRGRS